MSLAWHQDPEMNSLCCRLTTQRGNFTKIVQRIPVKIVFEADSMQGYEALLTPGSSAVVTVSTKDGR